VCAVCACGVDGVCAVFVCLCMSLLCLYCHPFECSIMVVVSRGLPSHHSAPDKGLPLGLRRQPLPLSLRSSQGVPHTAGEQLSGALSTKPVDTHTHTHTHTRTHPRAYRKICTHFQYPFIDSSICSFWI